MFVNLPACPHTPTYLTFCHHVKSYYNNMQDDENNQTAVDPENLANNDNEKENDELDEAQVLYKLADAVCEEWLLDLSYLEVIENMCKSGTATAQLMQHYLQALPPF